MSTKEKIIETALKLFSEKGYLGATTKEIAKEAGIAEVTLFRHFPSKELLFEETIRMYSFLPALKGLLPEIGMMDYEDALAVIAEKFLKMLHLKKDFIKIMHSEYQRYPEKIHEIHHDLLDEVFGTLASYFSEMQQKGVLRTFDSEYAAKAFFGMFFSHFNAGELMLRKKYRVMDTEMTIKQYVNIFAKGTLK